MPEIYSFQRKPANYLTSQTPTTPGQHTNDAYILDTFMTITEEVSSTLQDLVE